jgi:hypothetical protein
MSIAVKDTLRASRPPGSPGRIDKYLPGLAQDLRQLLEKTQREFLDHDEGIGAFYNPDEGEEFMLGFNHVLSGLRKQGQGLSETERDALEHFITDGAISPTFVRRLVREHGAASLLEAFCLRDLPSERALTFLLRCYKGRFYRNRYPALALVQSGGT